jgi:hypothetical protein
LNSLFFFLSASKASTDGAVGHGAASHEEGNPDAAVITGQTHFSARAVFHGVEQRDN